MFNNKVCSVKVARPQAKKNICYLICIVNSWNFQHTHTCRHETIQCYTCNSILSLFITSSSRVCMCVCVCVTGLSIYPLPFDTLIIHIHHAHLHIYVSLTLCVCVFTSCTVFTKIFIVHCSSQILFGSNTIELH